MTADLHFNTKNLTGVRVGRWVVLGYAGESHWRCRCDCGTERDVFTGNLTGKKTLSCGCRKPEATAAAKTTHGLHDSTEYKTWAGMKRRCLNANDASHARYGGAGVSVCQRWADSFEAFLADMGPKPSPRHTIDRIDNAKGYEPGNCRWATMAEQSRNKRTSRRITFRGVTKVLAEWSREFGLHHSLIQARLRAGWTVERALTTKPRKCRRR